MLKRLPQYLFSKVPFYGGADQLVNLISLQQTQEHQQIELSWRQLCDLELLINGALTPLDSYMDRQTYESVCINSRLPNGTLFPIPFILEIPKNTKVGEFVNLTRKGQVIAEVQITDRWDPNRRIEVEAYGGDPDHPEVQRINNLDVLYAGGKIKAFQPNYWTDFLSFRQTPTQIRELIQKWDRVVAFQTRNPMHFAHIELVKRAAQEINAKILLQPVSGPTKDGDIDYVTRMKAYEAVYPSFDANKTLLNLLPLAMRMGGPREALLHCIIRQNYGATHFILGRDHAGPGSNSKGVDFYKPYEARDHVLKNQKEFSIIPVPFDMVVYVENDKKYYLESEIPKGAKALKLSGTEVRRRLRDGEDIPEWFSPPKVVNILRKKYESDKWSDINKQLLDKNAKQIIQYAYDKFGGDIAISFSGAEDVILIEYAQQLGLPIQVFSLDTGRLHSETYKYFDQVEKHYNIQIQYCFPESQAVQQLVRNKGLFSFYKDGHNECCNVRKVQPLAKQLNTLKAWITGMRKDQNVTRVEVPLVTVDSMFLGKNDQSLIKFNPLSAVTSAEVWQDIIYYNVPYNSLHQKGFVSIGCEPCTKTILPNQHEREGRWWWEEATQKECGLHQKK
ncbi:Sulfate adenylyltransferase [Paramecium bursaria]